MQSATKGLVFVVIVFLLGFLAGVVVKDQFPSIMYIEVPTADAAPYPYSYGYYNPFELDCYQRPDLCSYYLGYQGSHPDFFSNPGCYHHPTDGHDKHRVPLYCSPWMGGFGFYPPTQLYNTYPYGTNSYGYNGYGVIPYGSVNQFRYTETYIQLNNNVPWVAFYTDGYQNSYYQSTTETNQSIKIPLYVRNDNSQPVHLKIVHSQGYIDQWAVTGFTLNPGENYVITYIYQPNPYNPYQQIVDITLAGTVLT